MTATTEVSLLEQHPLSAAFPAMPEQELEALAMDIEKHGQREPGVLFEGLVLDGWHRYLGCQKAGVEFRAVEFDGEDPIGFVLSKNLHRRHLTGSQRAVAAVTASEWRSSGVTARAAPGAALSTKQLAEQAEVSERTIRHAKAAHTAGLAEDVKSGEVSAKAAAEVAKLPAKRREKAIQAIKDGEAPKPPKEKKPANYAEQLEARLKEMADELAGARESLAEMTDLASSAKAFEEKDEFKDMQVLRVELRSCKRRRDELMAENAELKKEVARWRKRADKK